MLQTRNSFVAAFLSTERKWFNEATQLRIRAREYHRESEGGCWHEIGAAAPPSGRIIVTAAKVVKFMGATGSRTTGREIEL